MTVHFLHVGKTGGSAVKRALRRGGVAYWKDSDAENCEPTPYGRIKLHHHSLKLDDIPPDDYVFFFLRDPIARFISGFYSRLNKGQPLYYFEWTPAEREAFERFATPQLLAAALTSADDDEREAAHKAMRSVRHLRFMTRHLGSPKNLRAHRRQILYVGRQETLDDDWRHLRSILELPDDLELPSDPVKAHRGQRPARDTALDDATLTALRNWYARDYRLLDYCEKLRRKQGWTPGGRPSGWRTLLSRRS